MGEFFGSIYCWFEDFFGLELANYLWGTASPVQGRNLFIGIGMWMFFLSLVVVLVFYYLINYPKFNNWIAWLVALIINAVLNFIVGWQYVLRDSYAGKMIRYDAEGNSVDLVINGGDMLCFGVTNAILSIGAFIIFSFVFKWWSRNCSSAPF